MKNRSALLFALTMFAFNLLKAQNVGSLSTAGGTVHLVNPSRGMLMPMVALVSTTNPSPLAAHTAGIEVFNTATSGSGATAVSPGLYVNDGTRWIFSIAVNPSAIFTSGTLACGGALNGTYAQSLPMNAANTKIITITPQLGGTYTAISTQVNGVTFTAAGLLSTTASNTQITLTGTGDPITSGTFHDTVSMAGQTCYFDVTYAPAQAVYTLDCATSTIAAGGYYTGLAMVGSNTKTVTVNVSLPGLYNLTSITTNGISFAASGNFTTAGIQPVVLTASGSPIAAGTNATSVSGAGQSCTFNVTTIKSTFSSQLTFSGSVNSSNGATTTIPHNGIANETSNFGAGTGIISGGQFVAPVTGTYTFLINTINTSLSGTNRYDIYENNNTIYSSYSGNGYATATMNLTQGTAISQTFQTCGGCSPNTNVTITSENLTVTLL